MCGGFCGILIRKRNPRRSPMAKDSQLDPKSIRKEKAKDGPTMAESRSQDERRNDKKQSGSRHKPRHDR